jgi:uncharacterized membrane protein YhaH (DUF805 family)
MVIIDWYKTVLQKYAVFDGRARRSEYWYFVLGNLIVSIILGAGDGVLGLLSIGLADIYSLAILVPSIAVGVRRMHDVGKSGWFILIPLYNLYLAVQDSQPGSNEYGPNPKNPELEDTDHLVE